MQAEEHGLDPMTCAQAPSHQRLDSRYLRPVFIDALNVAYWSGNPPSLLVPLALMSHLLSDGHPVRAYFDASARYRLNEDISVYERLMQHPLYFREVASGRTADAVMLKDATSAGACVLSRDKYRDHRKRFRKLIDNPARLLHGFAKDGHVQVPALELDVALPASVNAAWEQLASVLS